MSIHTLPPGTDVLRARAAEMAAHGNGWLSRDPEAAFETFRAILARVVALGEALAPLDGDSAPDPLAAALGALRANRVDVLNLGYNWPWEAMGVLAPRFLSIEARVKALDKLDAGPFPVLTAMAGQVALDGYVHRHEEAFHEAMKILVGRVLAAEARVAKLPAPKVPTPKVPA